MNKHEIMIILRASLDQAGIKEEIEKIKNILVSNGATVEDIHEMGLRDLAYEIKKERKGYYAILEVQSSSIAAINEFDRLAKINANVLRHLVIALPNE